MDILKPQIITTNDGRRYRKLPLLLKGNIQVHAEQSADFEEYSNWDDEQLCDGEPDVLVKTDSGYTVSIKNIPSVYFKFICGKKNETKRRIEQETKTQITIPRPGCDGDVVIAGRERSGVLSAKTRIELTIESARKKQPATHFISIPLTSDTMKSGFQDFKERALDSCSSSRGLESSIFQIPEKLHLTIGLLVLMNENEIQKAGEKLAELKEEIKRSFLGDNKSLQIKLEGVEYMNDDPSEVDVLYAKIKPTEQSQRLQDLADFLLDNFVSSGFMKREYDRVKLHATIVNTIFRESRDEEEAVIKQYSEKKENFSRWKSRASFDARKLIELFQKFRFGEVDIDCIHISQRGSYGLNGYYRCGASLSLS